jgi:hypothetical protein
MCIPADRPCHAAIAAAVAAACRFRWASRVRCRARSAEHGAQWLWSGAVHREPEVRDWFIGALARHFPQAAPAHTRVYGVPGSPGGLRYTPKAYADRLARQIGEFKERYGLAERRHPTPRLDPPVAVPQPPAPGTSRAPRQLTLPV